MKKEKFGGFFKGMSSPLIGIGLINALVFGVESQALTAIGNETMYKHFLSGCFAGAVQAFVTSPVELAKTQMQVQGMGTQLSSEKKKYKALQMQLESYINMKVLQEEFIEVLASHF